MKISEGVPGVCRICTCFKLLCYEFIIIDSTKNQKKGMEIFHLQKSNQDKATGPNAPTMFTDLALKTAGPGSGWVRVEAAISVVHLFGPKRDADFSPSEIESGQSNNSQILLRRSRI